jgi:hypothetical protein
MVSCLIHHLSTCTQFNRLWPTLMTHEAQCYTLKTAADYAIWRDELSAVLQARGLWDLAFSEVTAPTQFEGEA